jgi:hypothetical protein
MGHRPQSGTPVPERAGHGRASSLSAGSRRRLDVVGWSESGHRPEPLSVRQPHLDPARRPRPFARQCEEPSDGAAGVLGLVEFGEVSTVAPHLQWGAGYRLGDVTGQLDGPEVGVAVDQQCGDLRPAESGEQVVIVTVPRLLVRALLDRSSGDAAIGGEAPAALSRSSTRSRS